MADIATMPALVIVIDEYAELADGAPSTVSDTDSIVRLARAVVVILIAATQRPTQKAIGQGTVRFQMDLRICFRVRELREVDLILGQEMLRAGWDANNLNAPGKFRFQHLGTMAQAGPVRARHPSHSGHWCARTPESRHHE